MRRIKKKNPFATSTERKAQAVQEVGEQNQQNNLMETKGEISRRNLKPYMSNNYKGEIK